MNIKLINDEGLFALPLYHATSDYFWEMIKIDGLGGFNIVTNWSLVQLAQELIDLLDQANLVEKISESLDWALYSLKILCKQGVTAGNLNYRHGGVYVSASRADALRYAQNNKGSELLTGIDNLLSEMGHLRDHVMSDIVANFPEAKAALLAEHKPIIVTVKRISIGALKSEQGEDPTECIQLSEQMIKDIGCLTDEALQLCRFEVTAVIPATRLTFESIDL